MEISITQSKIIKTIAIIMMLCLHLFNRPYEGLFTPVLFIRKHPLSYFISLFSDACVPIFLFSGYGLYFKYQKDKQALLKSNGIQLFKLYINYWLVVLLFAVLLGVLLSKEGYPGTFTKFALNFFGLESSYNGAWWFFFTYILLTLTSPFLFKILESFNTWLFIAFVFLFYFVSFYYRIYNSDLFTNPYLAWFFKQFYLIGTSLFPFIVGALVLQKSWHKQFSNRFGALKHKNVAALLGIGILILIHGFIPNFVIAPFLAIPFIFLWNQIALGKYMERFLLWLSDHATNLWLVHMFFYMTYFRIFYLCPKIPNLNICKLSILECGGIQFNKYALPSNTKTDYNKNKKS